MTPCIIESPYAGDVSGNTAYLQRAIRWCLANGMTPYASHQMLTGALDDLDPAQRAQGIAAGVAMARALVVGAGALHLFFLDLGVSHGMVEGLAASAWQEHRRHAILLDGLRDETASAAALVYTRCSPTGVREARIYTGGPTAVVMPLHDATTDTWGRP